MSKSVYLNVTPEHVKNAAEVIPREYPDSIIVLAPIFPKSTESPTKKRAYHKIKFEALIPAEAINGEGALDDFGGLLILRLPKKKNTTQIFIAAQQRSCAASARSMSGQYGARQLSGFPDMYCRRF